MPKVRVVFEDSEDGEVDVSVKFSPSVKPTDTLTPAQRMALLLLEKLKQDTDVIQHPETP